MSIGAVSTGASRLCGYTVMRAQDHRKHRVGGTLFYAASASGVVTLRTPPNIAVREAMDSLDHATAIHINNRIAKAGVGGGTL